VGAELSHADRQKDRRRGGHDEGNNPSRNFANAPKNMNSIGFKNLKNCPHFIRFESSLPCLQQPAISLSFEPDKTNPKHPTLFLSRTMSLPSYFRLGLRSGFFSSGFSAKTLSVTCITFPTQLNISIFITSKEIISYHRNI
jgi:hypothetical protein